MKEMDDVVSNRCIAVRRRAHGHTSLLGKVRVMKQGGASWPKQATVPFTIGETSVYS
jgi:hypothetical protein